MTTYQSKMIASLEDEVNSVVTHARRFEAPNDYGTLCGIDLHDEKRTGLRETPLPIRARIDCHQCISVIRAGRHFTKKDVP